MHVKDEGYVFALSAVLSMVKIEIVAQIYDILLEYVEDVLKNCKNTLVYKYCIVVIQILLQSKTKEQWKNDEDTLNLFIRLFGMCLNSKELVRRQAIRSFTMLCSGKDLAYFSVALNRIEEAVFKELDQSIVKVTARQINILNFLSCVLQVLPVSVSSNIVKKLLDYTEVESALLKKHIYFTIEIMFASTRLSADFVESFLSFLLEHQPVTTNIESLNSDEELMIVGYCLASCQVAVHYKKLKGEMVLQYLPTLISILIEYLTFGNQRVKTGSFNAIKNLMQYTLERSNFTKPFVTDEAKLEGLNLDMLSLTAKFNDLEGEGDNEEPASALMSSQKLHPIRKIVNVFLYCLRSRFDS